MDGAVHGQFDLYRPLNKLTSIVCVTQGRRQEGNCPNEETPRPEYHWTSTVIAEAGTLGCSRIQLDARKRER